MPIRNAYIVYIHRDMYKKTYSSTVHSSEKNNKKMEVTQMSIYNRMDKLWHAHTMEYYE